MYEQERGAVSDPRLLPHYQKILNNATVRLIVHSAYVRRSYQITKYSVALQRSYINNEGTEGGDID